MAQEAVEGALGRGGRRWLFTLHSDQSFLGTQELPGSKTGTRPVETAKTELPKELLLNNSRVRDTKKKNKQKKIHQNPT